MTTSFKDRNLIAVIGDEDTITGLLLAGIGHVDHGKKNFLVVDTKTQVSTIEAAFQEYTERKDIAILLINQHLTRPKIAEKIRPTVDKYQEAFPALLEIPSKDHPYGKSRAPFHGCGTLLTRSGVLDPSKDSVLKRVQKLFGE
ncbi:hypothetical protein EIP86_000161 [Pleurotus ostreatoroseus]|nr:hypothetical protein EIP86_000161 [Pleurotus ostreatoroseus]